MKKQTEYGNYTRSRARINRARIWACPPDLNYLRHCALLSLLCTYFLYETIIGLIYIYHTYHTSIWYLSYQLWFHEKQNYFKKFWLLNTSTQKCHDSGTTKQQQQQKTAKGRQITLISWRFKVQKDSNQKVQYQRYPFRRNSFRTQVEEKNGHALFCKANS